ncbi:MAG: hypothetical protein AAFO69_06235 [Bacteroidota bacterium]
MIFDFLFVGIAFYMAIPGVAGYCARSYGRSFWKWFAFGTFFPIITHLVLYFYIKQDIKAKKIISMLKKEEIEYMEDQIKELGGEKILMPHQKKQANSTI